MATFGQNDRLQLRNPTPGFCRCQKFTKPLSITAMNTEFEAKFLNIDPEQMAKQLTDHGYVCVKPRVLMTRISLHQPPERHSVHEWWRVRNEGDGTITMTYKRTDADSLDGTQEIEIKVDDFDRAIALLESTGIKRVAYQETWRAAWVLGEIEICIDEWPGLNPFIEIEGPDVAQVEAAARGLGFDPARAVFGGVGKIYQSELGLNEHDINNLYEIVFSNPPRAKAA